MRPSGLAKYLSEFSTDLLQVGIALDANPHIAEKTGDHITRVSWVRESSIVPILRKTIDASISRYLAILDNRGFSCVLADGSVLQMTYQFRRTKVIFHRLCFFPCPIELTDIEAAESPLADLIREMAFEELRDRFRLKSPLRFEYDAEHADVDHPASHLHMICDSCRVPVRSYIDPGTFISFIFRNFYPEHWDTHVSTWSLPKNRPMLSISNDEKLLPHLNWVVSR